MVSLTKQHALLSDIDLSLLPATSTKIEPWQQHLMLALEDQLSGAVAMITGRGIESVDKVFPGVAASVEQHAAWRPVRHQPLQILGIPMDVEEIVKQAIQELTGSVRLLKDILDIPHEKDSIFVEKKQFSLALVFSDSVTEATKTKATEATHKIMTSQKSLQKTHGIKIGSDSVEIGPLGVDKGIAVKDFMATGIFQGRIPVYIGDGPTDEAAMHVVRQMGGVNIAVGSLIKDPSLIDLRVNAIEDAWGTLKNWHQTMSR